VAGNVLIIRKPDTDPEQFKHLCERAQSAVKAYFSPHYSKISFHSLDPDSWLAIFHLKDDNKMMSSDQGWMVYEGMVFALNETKVHNIESLWKAYLQAENVDKFANELDGHFVIKIYDRRLKKYFIINDIIKDKSHYYCETDEYACYSTFAQLSALIKKPDPDLYAVNEYLWRYYILSEKTLLDGTQRMMPASIHTYFKGESTIMHYWTWPVSYSRAPFQEQVDTMIESLRETVRLIGSNYQAVVDFTQGQDSRQNVAAFLDQNVNFTTSIYGKKDFYEVQSTSKMAERYGFKHNIISLEEDFTSDPLKYFDRSILLGSGEEPGHLIGRIMYMREKQAAYGDLICNGMEGHFYKNGLWDEMYTFNFYREPAGFAADMFLDLRLLSQDYNDSMFCQNLRDIKKDSRKYFHAMIKRSISGMEKAPVSMQVDRFDLTYWLNFQFVSNSGSNTLTPTCSPLLFRRNLRHALVVPVKWKFNLSRYQRAIVHTLHPELAAEKTDFGGVNMAPKNMFTYLPFIIKYAWHQSQRLRNKILRKIGFHPKTHLQEAWDYTPIYDKLLHQLSQAQDTSSSNMTIGDLLETKEWDTHVNSILKQDKTSLNDYEHIFKVFTLDRFFSIAKDIYQKTH
jgi:hypothetical protein